MNIDITQFAVPIIVCGVYIVCAVVKSADLIPNKYIPLVAGALGVLFAFWFNHAFTFEIFVQGLASGFGATGVNQVIKQLTKEEPKKENEGK